MVIARKKGVISEETVELILQLIPIRQMLDHRYRKLDYRELWNSIPKVIEDAEKLQKEVRGYLRKTLKISVQ